MGIIAQGAQPIFDARKKGMKPVEMILVSLIGPINERNHTVFANPTKEYVWHWARGLQICIYASSGSDWRAVACSIASAEPSFLGLWDAERREGATVYLFPHADDIDKPQTEWRWNLDFLPWLDFQNKEFAWS